MAQLPTTPTDSGVERPLRRQAALDRVVQVVGDLVEVPLGHPAAQPRLVDVDHQADAAVERHRERLGPAHAAAAAGEGERAGQRAAEALGGHGGEGLVGALQDPLGPDVDPGAGGHLAVHGQAEVLQPAELRPGGPVADQVGVRDQHPRRPLVGAQDADRPAGLDEHRLVVGERGERADHRVEAAPVAGRPPGAAVDDEVVGALGDLGVEVVLQHPQRGLGLPAARRQRGAARGPYGSCAVHGGLLQVEGDAGGGEQGAGGDESDDGLDLGGEVPVGSGPGDAGRADGVAHGAGGGGRLQRGAEVEGAGGGEDLDREHAAQAVDRPAQLAGGVPAHRDVVLLHRRGRDRVDAGRHRQPLELADDPGRRVLGDHVAGVDARRRPPGTAAARCCGPCPGTGRCAARSCRRRRRRRWRGSRGRSRPGRRGSCRWTRPGRPG